MLVLGVERWVIISIMVVCNANAIIEYGGRRPGLPNTPVVMEHDNNRTDESTAICLNINHESLFTYSHIHILRQIVALRQEGSKEE